MKRSLGVLAAACGVAMVLSACGGGDDDDYDWWDCYNDVENSSEMRELKIVENYLEDQYLAGEITKEEYDRRETINTQLQRDLRKSANCGQYGSP